MINAVPNGTALMVAGFYGGESLQRFCLAQKLQPTLRNLAKLVCGGWEIRTPDQVAPMLPFQGSALDHYANPPMATIVALFWFGRQSNGILFL
jgi:hypothetical protein